MLPLCPCGRPVCLQYGTSRPSDLCQQCEAEEVRIRRAEQRGMAYRGALGVGPVVKSRFYKEVL